MEVNSFRIMDEMKLLVVTNETQDVHTYFTALDICCTRDEQPLAVRRGWGEVGFDTWRIGCISGVTQDVRMRIYYLEVMYAILCKQGPQNMLSMLVALLHLLQPLEIPSSGSRASISKSQTENKSRTSSRFQGPSPCFHSVKQRIRRCEHLRLPFALVNSQGKRRREQLIKMCTTSLID